MDNAAQKVKDWWEVADRTQRFVTVFGAGALIVLLVLTAYIMSQPRMTLLTTGLSDQDRATAVNALRKEGIPVELSKQNSINVPSNQVEEAQLVISEAGVTGSDGQDSFAILFGGQMFEGSDQQKERIRVAKERELAKTIMTWNGVSSANVHLNMQNKSAFAGSSSENLSSATINIVESGVGFGSSGGKTVAKLVQNATGIQAENITVTNNLGRLLYQGDLLSQGGSGAGQKLDTELRESRRREQDLSRSLDLAFGPGNTIAMVQVELDMDVIEKSTHEVVPNSDPSRITTSSEDLTGVVGQNSGGPVGTQSNLGNQPTTSPGGSSTGTPGAYRNDVKDAIYDGTTTNTTLSKASGELLGMTVQIIVNSEKVKGDQLKAVDSFVQAYLGGNKGKAGFSASVTATAFDTEAITAINEAADAMKGSGTIQQAITLLPVLALIVVGFLVIRAISKVAASRRPTYALAPAGGPAQFAQQQYPTNAPRVPESLQHEALQDMPAPETEAGQALATAIEEGEIHDALKIIEEMPEDDEIRAIRARINVPLEQIKHMAKTKPESVAMLLKGWMMEDLR